MNFGAALECAKDGVKIARLGWNGKGMYVYVDRPSSRMNALVVSAPHRWVDQVLIMKAADGKLVPWLASQTDLLADDWMLVAEITDANEAEAKFELDTHDDLE